VSDPRDEELDRLRAELSTLKAENARLRGARPACEPNYSSRVVGLIRSKRRNGHDKSRPTELDVARL